MYHKWRWQLVSSWCSHRQQPRILKSRSRDSISSRGTNSTKTIRTDVWLHPTALRAFSRRRGEGGRGGGVRWARGGAASQRVVVVVVVEPAGNSFGNERRTERRRPSCLVRSLTCCFFKPPRPSPRAPANIDHRANDSYYSCRSPP